MYEQAGLVLYKSRFLFAGVLAVAFLVLGSAVVTALGSGTVVDPKKHITASTVDSGIYGPNAVTAEASILLDYSQHALLSVGKGIYTTCGTITTASTQVGRSVGHVSAAVVGGVGHSLSAVGRGVGGSATFAVRAPGKAIASIAPTQTVHAIVRPADDSETPVISEQTSAAMLAQFNADQQQKIANLLAAQVAANQNLGGSIVAGDPNHGGYPAKWDNARQDSLLDSWGMYNRECVSYAAWKVHQAYGTMPYWGGNGNANRWVANAKAAGIPTSTTPKVHSVAISMHGYYGHAMWVEKVEGNKIYVSQYNYDLHGHYSEMWINASGLTYLYF
jgi:surface antigen